MDSGDNGDKKGIKKKTEMTRLKMKDRKRNKGTRGKGGFRCVS